MKASSDDIKELKRQLKITIEDLRKRLQQIEERQDGASQFAVNKFKELEKMLPKDVLKMRDISKIKTLYRDVKYISNLKTSTIKGAENAQNILDPAIERVRQYGGKEAETMMWAAYEKLAGETNLFERFKYEIIDLISETQVAGKNTIDVLNDIYSMFNKTVRKLEVEERYTDENLQTEFSSKLDRLRRRYFRNT